MAVFAVTYYYTSDLEEQARVRPAHREWLGEQVEAGHLLASGPYKNQNGALLIWQAETLYDVTERLAEDPFAQAELIEKTDVAEWVNVFGPWTQLSAK